MLKPKRRTPQTGSLKKQTINKKKINRISNEKKYKNKTEINEENISENFEEIDFLNSILEKEEDPEFNRQLILARKNLKEQTFKASVDSAIYQQLLEAKAAKLIRRKPEIIKRKIIGLDKRMQEITSEIKSIENLHKLRSSRVSKEQLNKLEFQKNEIISRLKKEYHELKQEREYISKLAKLTKKEIAELENVN